MGVSVFGTVSEADRLKGLLGYLREPLGAESSAFPRVYTCLVTLLHRYHSVGLCYAPALNKYQLFAIIDNSHVHYVLDVGARHPISNLLFTAKPIVPF